MRIDVRDRRFKVGEGLRNYVGLRLMSALDHIAGQVEGVTVRLADVVAPGDGAAERLAHGVKGDRLRRETLTPGRGQARTGGP